MCAEGGKVDVDGDGDGDEGRVSSIGRHSYLLTYSHRLHLAVSSGEYGRLDG